MTSVPNHDHSARIGAHTVAAAPYVANICEVPWLHENTIAMYARGMTVRDIQAYLSDRELAKRSLFPGLGVHDTNDVLIVFRQMFEHG